MSDDGRTAVEIVLEQHQQVRTLFSRLEGSAGDEKRDVFDELLRLLAVHETAEEMVIYPALRRAPGGDEIASARTEEENAAKSRLSDLESMGVEHDGFDAALQEFRRLVLDHAAREEQEALPVVAEHTDADQLRRMGAAFVVAETMAPTHPHPHAPESAVGNLLTGPFVGMVDRVRDAVRAVTKD
jgi:hemerythrin superfamily protein